MDEATSAIDPTTLLVGGILGMLLLATAMILFVINYQRKMYQQNELRREADRMHQRALLEASVEVQESERRRIASDLHDDIGSLLSAARLYLRQIEPGETGSRNDNIKTESLDILDQMITNTRRITHDLMPAELERFGFFAAAEELAQRVTNSGGALMTFRYSNGRRLPSSTEVALYRVLQELVNNTLKHAEAAKIRLTGEWSGNRLLISYEDDGKGFTVVKGGKRGDGLGLLNLESRITLVGGELHIASSPNRGMSARIDVPAPVTLEPA